MGGTNGFVERMNRTLLDECFRVVGRTTWYLPPDEIQTDLDKYLALYDFERTHQGYRVNGPDPGTGPRRGAGPRPAPDAPEGCGGGARRATLAVNARGLGCRANSQIVHKCR